MDNEQLYRKYDQSYSNNNFKIRQIQTRQIQIYQDQDQPSEILQHAQ